MSDQDYKTVAQMSPHELARMFAHYRSLNSSQPLAALQRRVDELGSQYNELLRRVEAAEPAGGLVIERDRALADATALADEVDRCWDTFDPYNRPTSVWDILNRHRTHREVEG